MGSHEYLLTAIEGWAGDIVMRYGLDAMFDFQWELWSAKVLPAVRELKARWMRVGDGTVEAFMKDIQIDASSFPGKAFEMTFEMPEPDVGIMTFNKCVQVDQWEALGRPDIAEKSAHVTCPASIIETAKMYNPNMKVEILAIPPRVTQGPRLLQLATVHARRVRPRIRTRRAQQPAGRLGGRYSFEPVGVGLPRRSKLMLFTKTSLSSSPASTGPCSNPAMPVRARSPAR